MFIIKKTLLHIVPIILVGSAFLIGAYVPEYYYWAIFISMIFVFLYVIYLLGFDEWTHAVLYGGLAVIVSASMFYIYSFQNDPVRQWGILVVYLLWSIVYFDQVLYYGRAKPALLPDRTVSILSYTAFIGMYIYFISVYSILLKTTISLTLMLGISIVVVVFFYYFCFWIRRVLYHNARVFVISGTVITLQMMAIIAYTSVTFYVQAFMAFIIVYTSIQVFYYILNPQNYLRSDLRRIVAVTLFVMLLVFLTARWI